MTEAKNAQEKEAQEAHDHVLVLRTKTMSMTMSRTHTYSYVFVIDYLSRADSAFCLSEGRQIGSVRSNIRNGTGNQGNKPEPRQWEKTLQCKENHSEKTLLAKEK